MRNHHWVAASGALNGMFTGRFCAFCEADEDDDEAAEAPCPG